MKEFIANMALSGPVLNVLFLIFLCAVIFLIYICYTFCADTKEYRNDISGQACLDRATRNTMKEFKCYSEIIEGVNHDNTGTNKLP